MEIENKRDDKCPEDIIMFWDDKYTQLCKEQNVEIFKNVTFGLPMPKVNDTQTI